VEAQRFGRYELLAELARGGMAELWLARLTGVGGFAKLVAIKRILPHLSDDPRFVEMFLAEGRMLALLSHPNICPVYELGEVDGRLFLAMEYLEGVSWERFLTALPRGETSRVRFAAGVLAQACDGLHYAHELHDARGRSTGIVHRDVSPQNLFVTIDGVCKVLDFGVAKVMSENTRTSTGVLKGKIPYMSPEQIRGEVVGPRADVFAAGIVLWEALTGERLFARETDFMIGQAVIIMPIPPVSAMAPFGAEIDAVVARALERDIEKRFPTMAALAEALRDVAKRFGGAATPAEIAALVRSGFEETLMEHAKRAAEASGKTPPRADPPGGREPTLAVRGESVVRRRRKSLWTFGAAAVVVLAGTAGILLGARRSSQPAPVVPHVDAGSAPVAVLVPAPPVDAGDDDIEIDDNVASGVAEPGSDVGAVQAKPRAARATGTGFFSVDSTPYATIYIDGKRHDQTPLFHIALPAGFHRVRAVLADGRRRTFTVQIKPGEQVNSGMLTW
jgi:serine/threonine-protein kinase